MGTSAESGAPRYRLHTESVAWSNLEPNAVLVHLDRDEVHLANPVAAVIVDVLQAGPATVKDLVTKVLDTFEVDEAQAASDIEAFLKSAIEAGVIEEQT